MKSEFKVYKEHIDKSGYYAYKNLDTVRAEDCACESVFRATCKRLMETHLQGFRPMPLLNKTIIDTLNKDPSLYEWCQGKWIDLSQFKQGGLNSLELIILLHMMQKGNATLTATSFELFGNFVSVFQVSSTIMNTLKINMAVNLETVHVYLEIYKNRSFIDKIMSFRNGAPMMNDSYGFNSTCANESKSASLYAVEWMLKNSTVNECNQFFALRDQQNKTPLIAASLFGMIESASTMLEKHLSNRAYDLQINAKDERGHTALDYAILLGHTDLVLLLLKAGAVFSSSDIVENTQNADAIASVYARAMIEPGRHVSATLNYFHSSGPDASPLMIREHKESGVATPWRLVVNNPCNADAKLLMSKHEDLVTLMSIQGYRDIEKLGTTTSVGEKRIDNLNKPKFLRELLFIFARLGMCREAIFLIKTYKDLDLVHDQDKKINLLHACTNSYQTSLNSIRTISPSRFQDIVKGRELLVEYLQQNEAELFNEKTITSNGEENFYQIVKRMHAKVGYPNSTGVSDDFDRSLYARLTEIKEAKLDDARSLSKVTFV